MSINTNPVESGSGQFEKKLGNIASYLPLGYLYLLLIGIASDTIYYGHLGVNIISYSTVLDVLLSPITRIADSLVFAVVILGIIPFSTFYLNFIKWVSSKSKKSTIGVQLSKVPVTIQVILLSGFMIFAAFMGYGFGGGLVKKDMLQSGTLKPDAIIEFQNGNIVNAHIIGNNSGFIFYVSENEKSVTVSPLQANVLRITRE